MSDSLPPHGLVHGILQARVLEWVVIPFSRGSSQPWWFSWSRNHLQCRRSGFDPWVGKIPWRRERLSTPGFCPGEFYGLYGVAESDTTEWLSKEQASFNSMVGVTISVILEPKKIKSVTVSIVSPSICHEVMGPDAMIFIFWMLSFKPALHSPLSLSSGGSLVPLCFLS